MRDTSRQRSGVMSVFRSGDDVHFHPSMSSSPLDRRAERLHGTSRVLHGPDDGRFDREFWRTIPPAERAAMVIVQNALDELLEGQR